MTAYIQEQTVEFQDASVLTLILVLMRRIAVSLVCMWFSMSVFLASLAYLEFKWEFNI